MNAKDFYDECIVAENTTFPSGNVIDKKPGNPNAVINVFNEVGTYYFYCGLYDHCKQFGVKAIVHVVDGDTSICPFHPTC